MGEFLIIYVVIGTVTRHSPKKVRKDGDDAEQKRTCYCVPVCRMSHHFGLSAAKRRDAVLLRTWDEGIIPGPMDGVKSATVTFTKDKVLETEVIEGRGEVQLPFMEYKVISQSADGSIDIQYLGSYYPLKSKLKRGKDGTLI